MSSYLTTDYSHDQSCEVRTLHSTTTLTIIKILTHGHLTFEDKPSMFYDVRHEFIKKTSCTTGIMRHASWLTGGEQKTWHFGRSRYEIIRHRA